MPNDLPLLIGRLRSIVDALTADGSFHGQLQALRPILSGPSHDENMAEQLRGWVAQTMMLLDCRLRDLVSRIVNARRFQQLEASWRGLRSLIDQNPDASRVVVRVFHVRWDELARDAEKSLEFEQSVLYRKIYSEEYGMPGGAPFGLLVADFEVRHRRTAEHPTDDVAALDHLAQVAAAAFAPVIVSASPELFGLESFAEATLPLHRYQPTQHRDFRRWQRLRRSEAARFVGVTLPRVLVRLPYRDFDTDFFASGELASEAEQLVVSADDTACESAPRGEESRVGEPRRPCRRSNRYLWGHAVYPLACVIMRSFAETGWFQDIVGTDVDTARGGRMDGLTNDSFQTEAPGVAPKFSTDTLITDQDEPALAHLGMISLCRCKWTELTAVHSVPSLHQLASYASVVDTRNEQLSSNLSLVLCVSRFAHTIKVIARDWIGSALTLAELQMRLNRWLAQYIAVDAPTDAERFRFPLRAASLEISESPVNPKSYFCRIQLQPHLYGTDVTAMTVVTDLPRRPEMPVMVAGR